MIDCGIILLFYLSTGHELLNVRCLWQYVSDLSNLTLNISALGVDEDGIAGSQATEGSQKPPALDDTVPMHLGGAKVSRRRFQHFLKHSNLTSTCSFHNW